MGLDSETNNQYIIITELHSSWMLVTSLICRMSQTHSGEERVWVWIARLIINITKPHSFDKNLSCTHHSIYSSLESHTHSGEERVWVWLARLIINIIITKPHFS